MIANVFTQQVLGNQDLGYLAAALFWALVGVIISLLIHATNRDKDSSRTPFKFNFGFLLSDNFKRILLNLILILVTLRFYDYFRGEPLTMVGALTMGITYDKLGEFLRNKGIIDKHEQTTSNK